MVQKYKAGWEKDFEQSMAADIESEFETTWHRVIGQKLPEMGKTERRVLFIAIARGVLQHLKSGSWDSIVVIGNNHGEGHSVLIDAE